MENSREQAVRMTNALFEKSKTVPALYTQDDEIKLLRKAIVEIVAFSEVKGESGSPLDRVYWIVKEAAMVPSALRDGVRGY